MGISSILGRLGLGALASCVPTSTRLASCPLDVGTSGLGVFRVGFYGMPIRREGVSSPISGVAALVGRPFRPSASVVGCIRLAVPRTYALASRAPYGAATTSRPLMVGTRVVSTQEVEAP